MIPLIRIFIKLKFLLVFVQCLNLRSHGIKNNYYVSSISVYRNRAFLSLPRSSCHNSLLYPTLIEVRWNNEQQTLTAGRKISYPSDAHQNWGKCNQLQNVVSIDVETRRSRLWVLDTGTKKCTPKLIIYNLFLNIGIYSNEFQDNLGGSLNSLVIDPISESGSRAFISDSKNNLIIMFSFDQRRYWRINLPELQVPINRLALSKTYPLLYETADDLSELYSMNLTQLGSAEVLKSISENTSINVEIKLIGNKLGPSTGMVADAMGGLNYYLTRDNVVLRWKEDEPLNAEHHDVLLQSFELMPYVSHLFNGPQNDVWALINPLRPKECTNAAVKRNTSSFETSPISRRIVKLSKLLRKGGKTSMIFFYNE